MRKIEIVTDEIKIVMQCKVKNKIKYEIGNRKKMNIY